MPQVFQMWESLSDDDRKSLSKVNDFFCGLHYIVALADQAEASLKTFESLCFPDGKVGSKQFPTFQKNFSSNGESGTTRLVRTACKLVEQNKGCEKSGKMVKFATWLKEEKNIE